MPGVFSHYVMGGLRPEWQGFSRAEGTQGRGPQRGFLGLLGLPLPIIFPDYGE